MIFNFSHIYASCHRWCLGADLCTAYGVPPQVSSEIIFFHFVLGLSFKLSSMRELKTFDNHPFCILYVNRVIILFNFPVKLLNNLESSPTSPQCSTYLERLYGQALIEFMNSKGQVGENADKSQYSILEECWEESHRQQRYAIKANNSRRGQRCA